MGHSKSYKMAAVIGLLRTWAVLGKAVSFMLYPGLPEVCCKAGWQKYDEITIAGVQIHFFRKPKRFGGFKKLDDKVEKRVDRFLCSA